MLRCSPLYMLPVLVLAGCSDVDSVNKPDTSVLISKVLASSNSESDVIKCDAIIRAVVNDERISLTPKQAQNGRIAQGIWMYGSRKDDNGDRGASSSRVSGDYFSFYKSHSKDISSMSFDKLLSEFQVCLDKVEVAAGGFRRIGGV